MASSLALKRPTATNLLASSLFRPLALKRLAVANLFTRSLLPPLRSLSTTTLPPLPPLRSFIIQAQYPDFDDAEDDDDEGERGLGLDQRNPSLSNRRRDFHPGSDALDGFSPARTIQRMDDNPFRSPSSLRRAWSARQGEDGFHLRVDMPGLGKEDVKVSVEENTLVIKAGEGQKQSDGEESGEMYKGRIDLKDKMFKIDQIRAEMKNGVLKVVVPRVKEEERTDVVHVMVQ
ncbi:hypothetical protein L1049_020914 [Liquidambar formosana]|uniref:SHSP domain-containing protein n=1 Tax=Liquidambar formosana TaxID=63359 RepID=A0AAP0S9V3_LIQFO